MALNLTPDDVRPDLSPKAAARYDDAAIAARIAEALALAKIYARCIDTPGFAHAEAATAIVRGAVVYDLNAATAEQEQGGTPRQMQSTGPFQVTNFAPTRSGTLFSPAQITALRELCPAPAERRAYSVPIGMPESLVWRRAPREEGSTL